MLALRSGKGTAWPVFWPEPMSKLVNVSPETVQAGQPTVSADGSPGMFIYGMQFWPTRMFQLLVAPRIAPGMTVTG